MEWLIVLLAFPVGWVLGGLACLLAVYLAESEPRFLTRYHDWIQRKAKQVERYATTRKRDANEQTTGYGGKKWTK